MDDRAKLGLRGPVRTCYCESKSLERNGVRKESTHSENYLYNPDGSLAEQNSTYSNGSQSMIRYGYDAIGRLLEIESGNMGEKWSKTFYRYDDNGRLIRIISISPDGKENVSETYSYDEQGRKTKTFYVPSLPKGDTGTLISYSSEIIGSTFMAEGTTSISTLYNEKDHPAEMLFHDAQHRLMKKILFRYDAQGHVLEESQVVVSPNPDILPAEFRNQLNPEQLKTVEKLFGTAPGHYPFATYRYDNRGRLIEKRVSISSLGEDREIKTYNEHGDELEVRSTHINRDVRFSEAGELEETPDPSDERRVESETRYAYQYDDRGNWTERTRSLRSKPDQPFTVYSIDHRTLTYY